MTELNGICVPICTTFNGSAIFQDYGTTNLTFHVGAGSSDTLTFSEDLALASNDVLGATGLNSLSLTSAAQTAISVLDTAIDQVSTTRSKLGATQNRLEHAIANVSVAVENLSAAESRIRDADMAAEMVTFTRNSILQQAGTAMLAQANAVPQSVLSLF